MRSPSARAEVSPVNPRRGFAVLIVVLAACVLMMSAQAPARGGRGTVLRSWLLTGSAPLTGAAGAVSRGVSGAIDHTAELFTARTDNERLRRELEASQRELFVLRSRSQQADAARRLEEAGAAVPNVLRSVPLLLVERRSGTYSAIVGAGSEQGVVPGSPLAVPEGLVGRVVTVGRGVSRAQFLLDASAAAGARVARTGELGVIRGDGRGSLLLNNIGLGSTIQRGDMIESAGIDGIYPRGVAIGRVAEVTRGGKLFLEIRVAPAADFSRLTDVLLLSPSPAVREMAEPGQGARVERDARLAAATAAPSPAAVTPHAATPPAAAPRTAAATAPAAPTPVVTTPAPRRETVTPRPSRTAGAPQETVRPTPALYPPLPTPTNSTSDAPQ